MNIFTYLALFNEVSFTIMMLECYFPSAQGADAQVAKAFSLAQLHSVSTHSTAQWVLWLNARYLLAMELHWMFTFYKLNSVAFV